MKVFRSHLLLCGGTGCHASGTLGVKAALLDEIKKRGLSEEVKVVETGCNGFCAQGPIMVAYPEGVVYMSLKPEDMPELVEEHLIKGRILQRLLYKEPLSQETIPSISEIPFFALQELRVLRNRGLIDPEVIDEAIARDGYAGMAKALTGMTPEQIIKEVLDSGLRGRGGAGFPTGLKWKFCAQSPGNTKYVLCNADEGDPGAFMDRSVLEADPHAVLEGMVIAARAIGSHQGYIYCRAEYPLAIHRLNVAISQAREYGLIGTDILGTGFDFEVEIYQGAGAFVCGEETALMTSIEGKRGTPRPRPPFPALSGLWQKPSILNNVETFANIGQIVLNGASWYNSIGTEKSKGTKVFALTGDVNNIGLVEVPMGTSLGKIVYEIGGGIPNGKKFKAAQLGGPSGGCIPAQHLNTPIDFERVAELGAIMGSGGLIVLDEDKCAVDVARFFMDFVQEESCGKCPPCRIGTKRLLEIITNICEGKGKEGDVEKLIDLGNKIKDTALCGLGQTAPNPVLSTIRFFRDEYDAHIREKRCPAGVCADLVRAPCQNACPAGVDVPGFVSLVGEERYSEALLLHRERNPFADICGRICFHPCESKCRRSTIDEPLSIKQVKRFMTGQEKEAVIPEVRKNEANADKKIAIIGAGPAGLSCAYFLARLGYRPAVMEATPKAGGMLIQTIPEYRLPRSTVEKEVAMLADMGVRVKYGARLGRDYSLQGLRDEGYEAIFLAAGAAYGSKLGIPGEDVAGVTDAISFLREYNLTGKAVVGENVVVLGGGNAAIDAARTALRLGAKDVTLLYRRTRAEMPAWAEEVHEAELEGVKLQFLVAPLEALSKNGKVASLKCAAMTLGDYDSSGRRRPVMQKGKDFEVKADLVISAIGQYIDQKELTDGLKVEMTRNGYVKTDPLTGKTSVDWLFAGGDVAIGPSSVVEAIAAGEKAAVGIDTLLSGADNAFWRKEKALDTFFDPDAEPTADLRARVDNLSIAERLRNFKEVEKQLPVATAICEAKRCLRCDYRSES
ncbi:MAG: FAD-dependent oxidoreductase [Smithellaceae bacterium]|nr:FAD-dependent oxidoreductase [Smithellaceae bacterium]